MPMTDTQAVIRVHVANPIAGGDVTVTPTASGCTITPSTAQVLLAASVTKDLETTAYVDFTVDRPAVGSPPGSVSFTSTSVDRIPDTDIITIPSQELRYVNCVGRITATTATTVTVTVTATAIAGTPTVGLVGVTGGATLASGNAAGTYTYAQNGTANVWVFNRAALNAGVGQAQFRAILSGFQSDDDLVTIEEQGRDTVPLLARARVTATTSSTVTARVAVADPYPQGANSVTVTYQDQGSGGVSPASGGTLTPVSTLTEAAGTYIDYTITRPSFQSGTGRVTFTAAAANRTSDSDALDIPAQERDTVELLCRATAQSTSATQVVFRVAVADPVSGGSGDVSIAYTSTGTGTVSPTSPQTIVSASVTADIATTGTVDFTVPRAAYQAGTGRITFTATRTGRAAGTDSGDVPSQDGPAPSLDVRATPGTTTYTITYTVTADTFEYSTDGAAYTSVPASGFTVSRNAVGGAAKTLVFRAVRNGQTASTEIPVPAQVLGTISLSLANGTANTGASTLDLSWSVSGMPSGTTYNCGYSNGGANVGSTTGLTGTSHQFTSVTFNGSPGGGALFVDAIYSGSVIASAKRNSSVYLT